MSFDPAGHPRNNDGKFAEKTGTAPDVLLSHESETLAHKLPDSPKVGGVQEHGTEPLDPARLLDAHEALKNQPPLYGHRLEDFIIDDDDDEDDEPYDASRKFSSLRGYPGMNGVPVDADLLHGKTMDDLNGRTAYCAECGDEMVVTSDGISHHITDGETDYDKDAQHVAIDDDEYRDQHHDYKETGDVLFVTEDGYEIQEATDGYAAYDADGNFVTGVMTASDDHDSIEDAFREQMAELKAASGE